MVAFPEVFWPAAHFRSSAPLNATPPPSNTPSLLNSSCCNLGPTEHTRAGVHKQCQSLAAWTSLASLSTVQAWQHVTDSSLYLPCTRLLKVRESGCLFVILVSSFHHFLWLSRKVHDDQGSISKSKKASTIGSKSVVSSMERWRSSFTPRTLAPSRQQKSCHSPHRTPEWKANHVD